MNRYLLIPVVLILAFSRANSAEYGGGSPLVEWPGNKNQPALGAYACITHRAVGIQGDGKKGERFAGAINLPEEQAKFTLTVKERTDGLVGSQYCADAKPNVFYKPGKPETEFPGLRYYSDLHYWFYCKATYELELSPSKPAPPLLGDSRYMFMDEGSFFVFHLFGNHKFVYTHDDSVGNFYMEEGQCQKM